MGDLDALAGQVVRQKPVPAGKKVRHAPYTAIKDQNAPARVHQRYCSAILSTLPSAS